MSQSLDFTEQRISLLPALLQDLVQGLVLPVFPGLVLDLVLKYIPGLV